MLDGYEVVLDSELDQFGRRLDPEFLHHTVLVKGDSSGRDFHDAGSLLHRVPLRQQLQYLALTQA